MNYSLEVGEMHELLENLFSVTNEFILPPPPQKKKFSEKNLFAVLTKYYSLPGGGEGDLREGVRNVKENIYPFLSVPMTHL